jgi:hypothetical protein
VSDGRAAEHGREARIADIDPIEPDAAVRVQAVPAGPPPSVGAHPTNVGAQLAGVLGYGARERTRSRSRFGSPSTASS